MRYLVLGVNGFVGQYVYRELKNSVPEHEVFGGIREQSEDPQVISLDLSDSTSVKAALQQCRPQIIINCAGVVAAGSSVRLNVAFTRTILEQAARVGGIEKVILSGSASVYGRLVSSDLPVKEETALNPETDYAIAKADEEALGFELGQQYGIQVVVMRIFNPIGKGMPKQQLLPAILRQLGEYKRGALSAVTVSRLDSRRDYVAMQDVAVAFRKVAQGAPGYAVYNVGSGVSTTNKELLDLAVQYSGFVESPVYKETATEPEPLFAVQANTDRLRKEFDWRPSKNIGQVIKEVIDDGDK